MGLLCVLALIPRVGQAQSDEQKREMFLRAREDIRPVPRAQPSATPRPKPKSVSTPTPRPTPEPTPTPRAKPDPDEDKPAKRPTPSEDEDKPVKRPTPAPTPEEDEKPAKPAPKPAPSDDADADTDKPAKNTPPPKGDDVIPLETPESKPTPTPKAAAKPDKAPPADAIKAPIVIEKSGLEADQGYEPAPKSTGGWFRRWRYLSPNVRKAIDQARVQKGRWKYIIVHNSGTRQGNARIFDAYHKKVRKMQNGLAYHFVIGNGSSSGNGEIEIGPRWTKQINGGHVASDYLNNIAIGICLVGDYNRDVPTKAQVAALDELITYLRGRVGKIKGKQAIVVPHKKINPKPTDCPGDRFPYSWLQQKFGS